MWTAEAGFLPQENPWNAPCSGAGISSSMPRLHPPTVPAGTCWDSSDTVEFHAAGRGHGSHLFGPCAIAKGPARVGLGPGQGEGMEPSS